MRLAPDSDTPEVLLDGLKFANGLAPSADESFLVIAETGARRLTRYLAHRSAGGPRRTALGGPGRTPGAPLDLVHRAPDAVRHTAARIAVRAPYRPTGTIGALAVDDEGHVVHHLMARGSSFRMVTGVCEAAGHLVLGSLRERGVALCEPPAPK